MQPVGVGPEDSHTPDDELLGFLVRKHIRQQNPRAGKIMGATAKVAINVAIELSNK